MEDSQSLWLRAQFYKVHCWFFCLIFFGPFDAEQVNYLQGLSQRNRGNLYKRMRKKDFPFYRKITSSVVDENEIIMKLLQAQITGGISQAQFYFSCTIKHCVLYKPLRFIDCLVLIHRSSIFQRGVMLKRRTEPNNSAENLKIFLVIWILKTWFHKKLGLQNVYIYSF